jgi:hypothetical protein
MCGRQYDLQITGSFSKTFSNEPVNHGENTLETGVKILRTS